MYFFYMNHIFVFLHKYEMVYED